MRRTPRAASRSTSPLSASTSSRSRRTSWAGRRGSARSGCAAAWSSRRRRPAGPRSAAGARGRRAGRRPSAAAWRPGGGRASWRRRRPPAPGGAGYASAWGRPPPRPTSTASSSCCRRWWRRRAEKRPPSPMGGRSRVVVAMSGGVDSAVAAARCRAAGHEVIGISLRLAAGGGGSCCSLDDLHDAGAVAPRPGFPHYVFDLADEFERRVIQPFVAEYVAGRTPNPCARCNRHLKFGLLWERARALGARWLATGHYSRVGTDPAAGRPYARIAVDAAKDQTYFLFALGPADLAHTLFPVGELSKAEVRAEAARFGLAVADKPESMEVCFVPGGDVAGFVERHVPAEALRPDPIVDVTGREVE